MLKTGFGMNWIKIDRDKNGFLADHMLEQMYLSLPVIVWDSESEIAEYIDRDNWGDWLSHLEGKPYYSHFMKIVLPMDKCKNRLAELKQDCANFEPKEAI